MPTKKSVFNPALEPLTKSIITAGNSLCSASEWDVAARVDDARSGASVVVHQGISLRLEVATANNNCK